MLGVLYPTAWLQRKGYPDQALRRRDKGEHEIRLAEWMSAFDQAGFSVLRRMELCPSPGASSHEKPVWPYRLTEL